MFCDYKEYLSEPTEADKVIEEMKDKLHNLVKNEAKEIMERYREAGRKLDSLEMEIFSKQKIIKNLKSQILELEKEFECTEGKMPNKYIDSFVRKYTGNFAPGDKVFMIDKSYNRITCGKCKGEKKIKAIINGEEIEINCIECKGCGSISNLVETIKETNIDKVYLKLGFSRDRVNLWSNNCIRVVGREYPVGPKDIFRNYDDAKESLNNIKD